MSTTEYKVHGAVAVITMDNPPVNGLGHDLRIGLMDGLKRAAGDGAVKAVVLMGTAKAFSGGADITEFTEMFGRSEEEDPGANTQRRRAKGTGLLWIRFHLGCRL